MERHNYVIYSLSWNRIAGTGGSLSVGSISKVSSSVTFEEIRYPYEINFTFVTYIYTYITAQKLILK